MELLVMENADLHLWSWNTCKIMKSIDDGGFDDHANDAIGEQADGGDGG